MMIRPPLFLQGKERAGRVAVQERAILILKTEAAAASRQLLALPGHVEWAGGPSENAHQTDGSK